MYPANGKDVFWEFVDLENTYDTVDWSAWYVSDANSICYMELEEIVNRSGEFLCK